MSPAVRTSRSLVWAGVMVFVVAVGLVLLMVVRPSAASPAGSGAAGAVPAEGSADVGFARDMSVHHQQAVEMAFLVRDRTDDEDVRRLAYDIINTQANQRGMMLGWLESWDRPKSSDRPPMEWMGHPVTPSDGSLMPGMATDTELDRLRAADGKDAEVLFLRLMTVHHRAGADMARAAAGAAGTDEIRSLAAGMARAQESEISLMADMLKARGAQP
ncbi:DUF305 domain-containing protein [[Kitasatospora] papulosa]|uniref:DUF305 domain-containing protein n=1 Tax=Streptomyces pratensis (strain ATCC 33331 / IAF-45CD) TaxID=591167 RepID=A0A8D3WCS5_STRFA|nr:MULTISPECIES: DUF305 domain-containing protein [Streptomyces]MBD2834775.1 DUF305 domain-containing protein [Streptomyces pratensis]MYT49608.1 DUF305 domain-containing protein [Streptomyces sp. SID7815]RAS35278.1 uncharacterized protein (DUF305 family) [Streptomyces avidinii]TPN07979.1 DUF305 domain-containing protein [Mesorhizobium sp. B2-3-3]SNX78719.1 Uncharacterized conserved protein, DUF305 family [Streptomyces microflavus]